MNLHLHNVEEILIGRTEQLPKATYRVIQIKLKDAGPLQAPITLTLFASEAESLEVNYTLESL